MIGKLVFVPIEDPKTGEKVVGLATLIGTVPLDQVDVMKKNIDLAVAQLDKT